MVPRLLVFLFFSYSHAATPPFSSSGTARLRSLSIRFFPLHVRLLQASTSVTFIIYLRLCRSPSTLLLLLSAL
ncbi:hypothetical protein RIF29_18988 [Crotalaria pallida]|uniref:Secreted protein n=1 Tax=Crotalaria pallida TaxID=3830 RepID=A0AAN9F0G6_CROPI